MALLFVALLAFVGNAGAASRSPQSFAYVLQADRLTKTRSEAVNLFRDCGRDWIVLDPVFGGKHDERWSAADLRAIRAGRTGRKIIAYFSIGEAENYRTYWRKSWDANRDGKPDAGAPEWLHGENPDWAGNYKVKYWRGDWQRIMLDEVERVMARGFDGLYLDIVDAFEFFEKDGKKYVNHRGNLETGNTFRVDMVAWVGRVAARARSNHPNALIIPQNAAQLLEDSAYCRLIDGIGVEDLFTNGKKAQKPAEQRYIMTFLEKLRALNKPVIVIDYASKSELRRTALAAARKRGYVLLQADRNLKTMGLSSP